MDKFYRIEVRFRANWAGVDEHDEKMRAIIDEISKKVQELDGFSVIPGIPAMEITVYSKKEELQNSIE